MPFRSDCGAVCVLPCCCVCADQARDREDLDLQTLLSVGTFEFEVDHVRFAESIQSFSPQFVLYSQVVARKREKEVRFARVCVEPLAIGLRRCAQLSPDSPKRNRIWAAFSGLASYKVPVESILEVIHVRVFLVRQYADAGT